MTGLAGKGRGYWNGVNSAKLFSRLNPYFISVDSLTLFPDTELYRMEQEGRFTPAGEKERLQELMVFIKNLQIRTHLFANSGSRLAAEGAGFCNQGIAARLRYGKGGGNGRIPQKSENFGVTEYRLTTMSCVFVKKTTGHLWTFPHTTAIIIP